MITSYKKHSPQIDDTCFVADNATVIGQVELGKNTSVWFGAVVRGDIAAITVGKNSNIQDNAVIHVGTTPAVIGDNVTVGHGAIVHSATVGNNVLVGMGSIVLDGAEIGDDCIIGAGAVVTAGTKVPAGSLVVGTPGKVIKEVSLQQKASNRMNATIYATLAKESRKGKEDE